MEILFHIHLPTYLVALTLLAGAYHLKKLHFPEQGILLVLLTNLLADVASEYFVRMGLRTHIIYNIACLSEQVLTILLYSFYTHSAKRQQWLLWSAFGMMAFALFNLNFFEGLKVFNTTTFSLNGFWVALQSYLIVRESVKEQDNVLSVPMFWFSLANFFYYILMVANVRVMISLPDYAGLLVTINQIAYGIWALFLLIGLLWTSRKTLSLSQS